MHKTDFSNYIWPGIALLLAACATSPTGRKQLILLSDSTVDASGAQAFQQLKQQTPTVGGSPVTSYVQCVVKPLIDAAQGQTDVRSWDIEVFKSDEINAFALPGGKIGVYTGILSVAKTQAQLAAVVGHEIGHVIARHGNERMSNQLVTAGGLEIANAFIAGSTGPAQSQLIMAALGVGTQVGIQLPFSRTQESEADLIGLKLMAEAGFDPRQAVTLWQNMIAATGGREPTAWLSSHPASEDRIRNLQSHMTEAIRTEQSARKQGKDPHCIPPAE